MSVPSGDTSTRARTKWSGSLSPVRISLRLTVTVGAPSMRPLTSMNFTSRCGVAVWLVRPNVEARVVALFLVEVDGVPAEPVLGVEHSLDGSSLDLGS